MKKKFITILMALVCALCCAFALAACNGNGGKENIKDGEIHTYRENGVTYEFRYSGVSIAVGGKGDIDDRGMVIKGIKPDAGVTEIIIPLEIGGEAVKIINDEGAAAQSIKTVKVPDSVTVILSGFNDWSALESIELSHDLKYIDFEVCVNTNIKSLIIPDSVMYLANSAFRGSNALKSVSAPAELFWSFLQFSQAAPYRASIKTVNVTSGNEIYYDTFKGYSLLESVTIAESVNIIGERAFSGLDSLAELNYLGTTAQWERVVKGEDWDSDSYFVVNCSDSQAQ